MTNKEAIEWLKYNKDAIERVAETGRFSDNEDVKQTIESINIAIAALEKQEGKKPIGTNYAHMRCPACNHRIPSGGGSSSRRRDNWCNYCGQKILWE